ncbi:uncharacterized protein EI90DRAFT_3037590 [Cantharellus anzutake]|uniref:uncharacterized protein n=1 Tax=Cantharellus anzutake TaxID=1750568 RepID=UPI001903676D|nr:uncharacterized protein EI90DRAFT_3037590 [Cantharellus anzutake]KAF8339726.1 hypothetical protein EI90DRAFT_3037590 [Cantharellus anzutake]
MQSSSFKQYARGQFGALHLRDAISKGRRATLLEIANSFWGLDPNARRAALNAAESTVVDVGDLSTLQDPLDFSEPPYGIVPQRGVIVRVGFSSDPAWNSFLESVLQTERDGIKELLNTAGAENQEQNDSGGESSSEEDTNLPEEGESSSQRQAGPAPCSPPSETFIVIDPSDPTSPYHHLAPRLQNATNITLLRLFSDLDIIPTLPVPPQQRIPARASSPLIDMDGLHEIYEGRTVWVYDEKSNQDGSVRLIVPRPTTYGLATGDSWRVRAPFIWELQINLSGGNMMIDFGGLDRYDAMERRRNLEETKLCV